MKFNSMLKKDNLLNPYEVRQDLHELKSSYNTKEKKTTYDNSIILPKTEEIKLFTLKKNKSPIKTINYINNDSGKTRHFTPAAQEWYNSIYSYNKNYIKLLPSADKNAMRLLKSYFNLFVSHKVFKTKRIASRYRKASANKVFVGKGELKHINNKIIITSYIYNIEQFYLKSLVRKENMSLYYPNKILKRTKYVSLDKNKKDIIAYNRPLALREYLNIYDKPSLPNHFVLHKEACFKLFWKQYVKLIGIKKLNSIEKQDREIEKKTGNKYEAKEFEIILKLLKLSVVDLDKTSDKNIVKFLSTVMDTFGAKDNNIITAALNLDFNKLKFKDKIEYIFFRDFYNINDDTTYQNFINSLLELAEENNEDKLFKFKQQVFKIRKIFLDFDLYMTVAKNHYLKEFKRFTYLLMISTVKFKTPFVSKLLCFLESIYKKKVELNVVNLNKMHLNSDIYTQIVSLKLKNRNNKLLKVLRWSLNKVNLPNVNRMTDKQNSSNKDNYLINKIRNTYIKSMFNNVDIDPLNNLLLSFFNDIDNLKIDINNRSSIIKRPSSLHKYIIKSLKHLKLAGIRVEAKGRLTKRFTASRSVFKLKWKGGLKNVDSSFKGLSAIMLRGDRKSNVQYSLIKSKNRNGAYGVKGWISSK